MAGRLGFSFRKARVMPCNGATAGEWTKLIEKTAGAAGWKAEGRVALSVNATTPRGPSTSGRGLRLRDGKRVVRTNRTVA